MADDSALVSRQVNLTFALLASRGRRDIEWIQRNVDGYGGRTREAAGKLVVRDVEELQAMWVPVHYLDGEVWLDKDLYELPPIDLTAEEATAVGLAVDVSQSGSLGAFARSGWTKLAASGATRTFDAPALESVSNDIMQLDPDTFRAIVACVRHRVRISFDFVRAAGKPSERRTIDPWGIVPLNNRAYLVGYDVDREAERVFRVRKVSKVKRVREAGTFHPPTRPLQEVVEDALRGEVTDAVITLDAPTGEELARRGSRDGDTIVLRGVERDWVVRTTASLAGNLVAVEPEDIRREVVALLQSAIGDEEGNGRG